MTSTTQEVTAEQIAAALGWHNDEPDKSGLWWPPDTPDGLRSDMDGWHADLPPYLEDSPEGYATLREFEADCKERGWPWTLETDPRGQDVLCTIDMRRAGTVPLEIAREWADSMQTACWTAWYRAVQAQEQA